ncbi:MAG: hypothetical protein SVK54_02515 [candidate division WOR-3 bacterium]|nr:hypothetical protein [candidate division WOR-3 bacterium]
MKQRIELINQYTLLIYAILILSFPVFALRRCSSIICGASF